MKQITVEQLNKIEFDAWSSAGSFNGIDGETFNDMLSDLRAYKSQVEEMQKTIEEKDRQLTYYKCPYCSATDYEYCTNHFPARTEIWAGGDGFE